MKHYFSIFFAFLGVLSMEGCVPAFAQVVVREASAAEAAAGTLGAPVYMSPRRVAGSGGGTPANTVAVTSTLTLSNAVLAAKPGNTIYLYPAAYTSLVLNSNILNYNFAAGSTLGFNQTVTYEAPVNLFNDNNGAVSNIITGDGQFMNNAIMDFQNANFVNITNPKSVFYFSGNSFTESNHIDGNGFLDGGNLFEVDNCKYVNINLKSVNDSDDANGTFYAMFIWKQGTMDVTVDTLTTYNNYAIITSPLIGGQPAITNDTWFSYTGKEIHTYQNQYPIWDNSLSQNNGRLAVNCGLIISDQTAVLAEEGGGPVMYLTSLKQSGASTANVPVISEFSSITNATNILFDTCQKLTSVTSAGELIMSSRAGNPLSANSNDCMRIELNIQTYELLAPVKASFQVDEGRLVVNGGTMLMPFGGRGLVQSGGVVTLNNLNIDTSGVNVVTNCDIFIRGGTLTINGGNYLAGSAANSIDATNAQTVNLNYASFNRPFSTNITATGNWSISGTNYSSVAMYMPSITTTTSNTLAPSAITFPATTVNWTNTTGRNIFVFIDNAGVTGTLVKKNGTQIASTVMATGDTIIPLQPGEYFSETYTVGTPVGKISPY